MDCEIGRIRRAGLFFDLQEERVVFAVAFEVDEVVAQAHAAGTHHLECDIHGHILIEEVPPLRQEAVAIPREACKHGARLGLG